jgi:hypothetical protein
MRRKLKQEGTMAMTAKVARSTASLPNLSEFGMEPSTDEDKKEIQKLVEEFLDGFEADYRQKIKDRNK